MFTLRFRRPDVLYLLVWALQKSLQCPALCAPAIELPRILPVSKLRL